MMTMAVRSLAVSLLAIGSSAMAFELVIPPEGGGSGAAESALATTLENGDFEESAEQGAPPPAWTTFGVAKGVAPNVAVTLDTSRGGRASLRLAGSHEGDRQSGATQRVAVRPGDWVRLDAWTLVSIDEPLDDDGRAATLSISFHGSAEREARPLPGSNAKPIAEATSPVGAWARCRFVLRVPDDAREARVTFAMTQRTAGVGSVRVDDVSFEVIPAPVDGVLPGDFNRDGRVDNADYTVWRDASSGLMPPDYTAKADANGDGVVDEADRQVWYDHVGLTAAPED